MNGDLPPSSSVSVLPLPAVALRMIAPDLGRSREGDLVDIRMIDKRRAGVAIAGDDIEHARAAGRPRAQISANSSAVSGVNSAGFSTTVLPAASAGAIFQASISSGKFHGMIWPTTPTGTWSGNSRSMQLRPAGMMIEVARRQRHVEIAGFADRLAIVERFQHREQARMALHQRAPAHRDGARDRDRRALPMAAAPFARRRPRRRHRLRCLARSWPAACRWPGCDRRRCLPEARRDEFAADEVPETSRRAAPARRAPRRPLSGAGP